MRDFKITKSVTDRNDESIKRHLHDISRYRMIDAGEEIILAAKIRAGDRAAEHRLVTANLRFVVSVAKKYRNMGINFSDLVNEGNMGLLKAARLFDETRGFKFISYAVWWIRQAMLNTINEYSRTIRIPMNQQNTISSINKEALRMEQVLEREPTAKELAEATGKNTSQLADYSRANLKTASLDDQIPGGKSGESTLLNYTPYDEDQIGDWMATQHLSFSVTSLLNKLTPREKQILILTYGLYDETVLETEDIGIRLKLSKERVRQIRSIALAKLRDIPFTYSLKEYA